jgi:hypothetical protein
VSLIILQVAIIRPGPIVGEMRNPFLKRSGTPEGGSIGLGSCTRDGLRDFWPKLNRKGARYSAHATRKPLLRRKVSTLRKQLEIWFHLVMVSATKKLTDQNNLLVTQRR